MRKINLISGFLTVGAWTMASRILGFVRDILIAAFLGAGPVAQAFFVAFTLPNMFRRFFAEGAFNMAFVPMFSKRLESGENPKAFAEEALAGLATLLIGFTLVAMAVMPWLVLAMASGFRGDERFDLAVDYGRIAFPYIFFISLAALLSGVLNATGRFMAAAAAPVLLNVIFISAMLAAHAVGWEIGNALTWAVPVAGVAQLALLWGAASRAGFGLRFVRPRLSPEMRHLAAVAFPAMLAGGVVQINMLVGRQVASFFDGALAWLFYADRLYQLPLGVVGIAIGVVLLPDLSRKLQARDDAGGRHAFNRACEASLALTIPAAIALIVIPLPLISVLFERGEFGETDARATALAVAVYGAGLPAFVLQKVLQPLYFAREDTKTPFRYAVWALLINAAVAIGLAPFIGYIAAALGTTAAGWAMAVLLWRGSLRMGAAASFDDEFRRRAPRILAASLLMGGVAWGLAQALDTILATPTLRYAALAILIAVAMGAYALFARMLGAFTLGELRASLKR